MPTHTPTPTSTPSPSPTATPTPTVTPTRTPRPADVRVVPSCCQFDPPGNDNLHLNDEYVCLENQGGLAADMTRWQVKDLADHTYTFPAFALLAGARVKLRTGCGTNTLTDVYWCQGGAVWNNDGDTVLLYDSAGVLVDQYRY